MNKQELRAVMVAVNYTDLLAVTLPYNIHHFSEVTIITDNNSAADVRSVCWGIDNVTRVPITILQTDLFYKDGATFNKWRALEWGLDIMGRRGLICNMDADVLWPKEAVLLHVERGELWTPLRRMCSWPISEHPGKIGVMPPDERDWPMYEYHRNFREWAGYSQIFHADDPHLGPAPWHDVTWKHAGGADSFFQAKWPMTCKHRPSWEVLHLGDAGANWYGRATPLADGSTMPGSAERLESMASLWSRRWENRRIGRNLFDGEKLEDIRPTTEGS